MTNTAAAPATAMVSLRAPQRSRSAAAFDWIARIVAAVILGQTLFFKFTAAPESVYIFTKVHMEPWGRIGSGIVELIAAILLLISRTAWLGALLAVGVISGAVLSHLTLLGIEVQGDGGLLFFLALAVLFTSAASLFIHRRELPIVGTRF